jgi:hypothetical protein
MQVKSIHRRCSQGPLFEHLHGVGQRSVIVIANYTSFRGSQKIENLS